MDPVPSATVLPPLVLAIGIFWLVAYLWGDRLYAVAGTVALVGHVVVGTVVVPRVPYDWDIAVFHKVALDLLDGGAPGVSNQVEAFALVVAPLYELFGATPAVVVVLNALCATLVAIPVVVLVRTLYPDDVRPTGGVTVAVLFVPIPFFFLSIPMRDALSVLLFFCAVATLAWGLAEESPALALAGVPLVLLMPLRSELVAITVVGGVVATGVCLAGGDGRRRVLSPGVGLSLMAGAVTSVGAAVYLWGDPLGGIEELRRERARGGAVYLSDVGYESWVDLGLASPVRAVYFQFAPFPHHVGGAFDLIAASALPVLVVLGVAGIRSLVRRRTRPPVAVLSVTVYVLGIVGYGLINSNFGTTVRHRIPFVFLLLVFAAPVLRRWEFGVRRRLGVPPGDGSYRTDTDERAGEAE
jgi:hypothetical protein